MRRMPNINNKTKTLTLSNLVGGLNIAEQTSEINDNQSPDMLNMWTGGDGSLISRYGQDIIKEVTPTEGAILAITEYKGKFVFATTNNLYSYDVGTSTLNTLYSTLTSGKGTFFEYNNNLYYFSGMEYIRYNENDITSTVGTNTEISTNTAPTDIQIIKIDTDKYIFKYQVALTLYMCVIKDNGTSFTIGTEVSIDTGYAAGDGYIGGAGTFADTKYTNISIIDDTYFLVTYTHNYYNETYNFGLIMGAVCNLSGVGLMDITKNTAYTISGRYSHNFIFGQTGIITGTAPNICNFVSLTANDEDDHLIIKHFTVDDEYVIGENTSFVLTTTKSCDLSKISDTKFIVVRDNKAFILTVGETTFTLGAEYSYDTRTVDNCTVKYLSNNKAIITYGAGGSVYAIGAIISSNNIQFVDFKLISIGTTTRYSLSKLTDTKATIAYINSGNSKYKVIDFSTNALYITSEQSLVDGVTIPAIYSEDSLVLFCSKLTSDGKPYIISNTITSAQAILVKGLNAYTPTTYTASAPNFLTKTVFEIQNMLTGYQKIEYDVATTASTTFTLFDTDLDAGTLTVWVNGTITTPTSTDYPNGTFVLAGATEGDKVIAQACKSNDVLVAEIHKSNLAIPFGGQASSIDGGLRYFISGNPDFPNQYRYSYLQNPEYFTTDGYALLNTSKEAITAFGKEYGELIIFKTDSVHALNYQFDGTGSTFTVRELNSRIGCDITSSVQLVDNRLIFANTKNGVFMLDRTDNTDERNIKPLSLNINKSLLIEATLTNATSADYDRKYWLCVNGNVYVWDYNITPYNEGTDLYEAQKRLTWYKLDNIYSNVFFEYANDLYYGHSDKTAITIFDKTSNSDYTSTAINKYWKSKSFDFGEILFTKNVFDLWVRALGVNTTLTLDIYDTKNVLLDTFTFTLIELTTLSRNLNRSNLNGIQVKISNNTVDQSLFISDLIINYSVNKLIQFGGV